MMYNEMSRGYLIRCLENCKKWATDIVIYDDASTDDSIQVAKNYTEHIIKGKENCWERQLYHKQELLDYCLKNINPEWIMWIDCDEILDKDACEGGLLQFCQDNLNNLMDGYGFQQINLWRGESYYRKDSYFYREKMNSICDWGWFCRLWRVKDGICFKTVEAMHEEKLYPKTIKNIGPAPFKIINYGFANYKNVLIKIGVSMYDKDTLIKVANGEVYKDKQPNWILDERNLICEEIPSNWFPKENLPSKIYKKPEPKQFHELISYSQCLDE